MNFVKHFSALVVVSVLQFVYVTHSQSRSANLALETILDFNNEDLTHDIKTIDQLQHFLKRLKAHVVKNSKVGNTRRHRAMSEDVEISDDQLDDIVNELLKYNDEELESIMRSINKEIKHCQSKKKCPFKELIKNESVKDITKSIFGKDFSDYVRKLRDFLVKLKTDFVEGSIGMFFKNLYNGLLKKNIKVKIKTNSVLKKIKSNKNLRSHNDSALPELYRKAFKTLIIDQYQQMDEKSRKKIINEIEMNVKLMKSSGNSTNKDGGASKTDVNSTATVKVRKHSGKLKRYKVIDKNTTISAKDEALKKSKNPGDLSPKIMTEEYNAIINLGSNFKNSLFEQLKRGILRKHNIKESNEHLNGITDKVEDSSNDGLRIENFAAVPVEEQNSRRLVSNVTISDRSLNDDGEYPCSTPKSAIIEPIEFDNRRSAITPFISDSDKK